MSGNLFLFIISSLMLLSFSFSLFNFTSYFSYLFLLHFLIFIFFCTIGEASLQIRWFCIPTGWLLCQTRCNQKTISEGERYHVNCCSLLVGWKTRQVGSFFLFSQFVSLFSFSLSISLSLFLSYFSHRSLAATIKAARPDLLKGYVTNAEPISEEIPPNFFDKQIDIIEDVGQPTTACFFTSSPLNVEKWFEFAFFFLCFMFSLVFVAF